jgi:hypothetical protein
MLEYEKNPQLMKSAIMLTFIITSCSIHEHIAQFHTLDLFVKEYDHNNRLVRCEPEQVRFILNDNTVRLYRFDITLKNQKKTEYGFMAAGVDKEGRIYHVVYEINTEGLILLVTTQKNGSYIISTTNRCNPGVSWPILANHTRDK